MRHARCQALSRACACVRLGSVSTAQLAKYDGTRLISTPFFSPFITSTHHQHRYSSQLTCYHPRRLYPHRHRTRRVLTSSTSPVSSSTSYSSRLDIIHAAGILIDIVLASSIVQHPTVSVSLRAALTISQSSPIFLLRLIPNRPSRRHPHRYPHRHRTRRVLLDIIHAAGILIDIVLVASYLTSSTLLVSSSTSYLLRRIVQLPTVSVPLRAALTISQSSPIISPCLIRNRPSHWHPHRCPHRHRTCRVLLDIIHAASILTDIVLVTS